MAKRKKPAAVAHCACPTPRLATDCRISGPAGQQTTVRCTRCGRCRIHTGPAAAVAVNDISTR